MWIFSPFINYVWRGGWIWNDIRQTQMILWYENILMRISLYFIDILAHFLIFRMNIIYIKCTIFPYDRFSFFLNEPSFLLTLFDIPVCTYLHLLSRTHLYFYYHRKVQSKFFNLLFRSMPFYFLIRNLIPTILPWMYWRQSLVHLKEKLYSFMFQLRKREFMNFLVLQRTKFHP